MGSALPKLKYENLNNSIIPETGLALPRLKDENLTNPITPETGSTLPLLKYENLPPPTSLHFQEEESNPLWVCIIPCVSLCLLQRYINLVFSIYRFSILISKWTLMTLYFSFCASETDIMACTVCRIIRKRCTDNCCFENILDLKIKRSFWRSEKIIAQSNLWEQSWAMMILETNTRRAYTKVVCLLQC